MRSTRRLASAGAWRRTRRARSRPPSWSRPPPSSSGDQGADIPNLLFAKLFDTDTADAEAARALQRAVERQTAIESELLFFSLELRWMTHARSRSSRIRYSTGTRTSSAAAAPIPSIRPVGGGGARREEKSLGGVRAWERLNTERASP